MPTVNDDPTPLIALPANDAGRYTDNGVHYAETIGGQPAWQLVPSTDKTPAVYHVTRTDPQLGVVPTPLEISDVYVDGQTIFVNLPNEVTEVYLVTGGAPILQNRLIGPRLYSTLPLIADFNLGEAIELYGQVDPDDDGVYILTDTGGPIVWVQA